MNGEGETPPTQERMLAEPRVGMATEVVDGLWTFVENRVLESMSCVLDAYTPATLSDASTVNEKGGP